MNSSKYFGIILNYSEKSPSYHSFYNNNKPKLFPQNRKCLLNTLQLMQKKFVIATSNGSSKFNTEILKLSSPEIFHFLQNNSNNSQYYLNCADDKNVLGKLEQLYQGKPVIIEKSEIKLFQQITQMLQIKINSKTGLCLENYDSSIKAIIDCESLFNIIYSNKSFTIKTDNKEYQCNPFGINLSATIREFLL